jgi:hypothetical protein
VSAGSQLQRGPVLNCEAPDDDKHEYVFLKAQPNADDSISSLFSSDLHVSSDKMTAVNDSEHTSAMHFVLRLGEFLCSLDDSWETSDIDLQLQNFASQICEGMFRL